MKIKRSLLFLLFGSVLVLTVGSYATDNCPCYDLFYRGAVFNAMLPDESDIYNNLTPIAESNNNLSWQGEGADKRVLMVVWTKYPSSYPVGQSVRTSWGDTWVTVYPEIQSYFTNNPTTDEDLKLQVAQLLGLPPNTNNSYFVELWVKPTDLFRPSADNEINDTVAQLNFPNSTDLSYKIWFINNTKYSYFTKRLPWTRLGYTYHWENNESKIGLSEFVIKKNSEVTVKSLSSTSDYLNQ
ncbi:hypothetical protein [Methanobacterium sp.]|uniref:hypothetical protein n=1 Tax=Methanobacterium sp. TaxID=2164 RepID=UPI002ABA1DC1|nr:hypothetical protein [Methanobacterium sp.]MDY9923902.1 hypothetical protein [Methanobacterium sp.]